MKTVLRQIETNFLSTVVATLDNYFVLKVRKKIKLITNLSIFLLKFKFLFAVADDQILIITQIIS